MNKACLHIRKETIIMPKKERITFLLILICVSLFLYLTGIGCPLMFITGISCPSCGMTRACLHMLTLDFSSAFHYHPLCFTVPFLGLLILFYDHFPKKFITVLLIALLVLFFVVYFIRLFDPTDSIVVMEPSNGLLYRRIVKPLQIFFSFITK